VKIVNVHFTGFGGLADVVHGIVAAPGAEAHQWVMAYYGVVPLDPSHLAFCAQMRCKYAVFRPKRRRPWIAWLRLSRWIVSEHPDIIICHSSTAIIPSFLAARLINIPIITVEHTPNDSKSFTEWIGSFLGMILANRVVVLTDVYRKRLASILGPVYNGCKVRIIPNGIDLRIHHPSILPHFASFPLRAGMAARFSSTKLQHLLVDAVDGVSVSLDLAGDGDTLHLVMAKAASKANSQIRFNRLVPAAKMPDWFRGLDIYLHASEGETFSMSLLQAMAAGLPIIASDISGMEEILGADPLCALLVPNTLNAWHLAISTLVHDSDLRLRLGLAARKRAESLFSSEKMFSSYLTTVRDTLLNRREICTAVKST